MMSMENLSVIMIMLIVAVVAAGSAYAALRVWGARMVESDHPDPRSPRAQAIRTQALGVSGSARLEIGHERPVI